MSKKYKKGDFMSANSDLIYGLNDKIASLNNAKSNLLKDKQKYTDALSTLGGYV